MTLTARSVERIVEDQVQRWQMLTRQETPAPSEISVVTLSREPGSGGRIIAQQLAEKLQYDMFHQEVIHELAEEADVSTKMVETLDARGLNVLEEWISSLVEDHHLWPDQYLHHLMKLIGTIGKHGRAVLVGRGANFVLPPDQRFSVRVIAPLAFRIEKVAREFDLPKEEARRRVIRTDSNRKSFIRKYFNADIADPANYDLLINTRHTSLERAVGAIDGALGHR